MYLTVMVQFTLQQATKAQSVSRGTAVLFNQPRPQHHAPAALNPGKTRYPL
jgi:hypothetical protein